jgi:osmotically-inducible protein OsmY
MKRIAGIIVGGLLLSAAPQPHYSIAAQTKQNESKPQLKGRTARDARAATASIANEVRHELVTLPYYDVFDWLEGEVRPDATVVLRGEVTRPSTKSDAEKRVKSIESVSKVVNQIEVLPVSQFDDDIRRQVYRAIFKFDSPLFMYGVRAVPPIHIIVKGGRVTLKGMVLNDMDRQLAETYARGVPSVFEVKNELAVENKTTESKR